MTLECGIYARMLGGGSTTEALAGGLLVLLCALPATPSLAGEPGAAGTGEARRARIEGRVLAPSGAPIPSARVRVEEDPAGGAVETDREGRFVLAVAEIDSVVHLVIEAGGYEPTRRTILSGARSPTIVLRPVYEERVSVTAARIPARLSETPSSVVVLDSADLSSAGGARLDGILRQVPGFSLFRRTDSRTANPTSQGLTLRGIGPSGASRALVLDDGVPLNDPFGGWIYWARLPVLSLERVDLLRGGGSDLYGSAALSGVVDLVRRRAAAPFLSAETAYGDESTSEASIAAGGTAGRWGGTLTGESFRTDGFVPVADNERGPVDLPAGTHDATADLTGEYRLSESSRLFLRGSWLDESRQNGTPLQTNDTNFKQLAGGWDRRTERSDLSLRLYASRQNYDQSFSAVSSLRASETLSRVQEVPSRAEGAILQWSRGIGAAQRIVVGGDLRIVEGESDETIFATGGTSRVDSGGEQRTGGLFAEDVVRFSPAATLTVGLRYDRWENVDASRTTNGAETRFADRHEDAVSPRVSLLARVSQPLSFTAAVYRAFRAPTLNELYRSFRVGNTLTLANENLAAEHLTGGEAGLRFAPPGRVLIRGDLFWMEVHDPVANVTLSTTPALITKERQNLGSLRSRGVELDAEARPGDGWTLSGGYLFADAVVTRFSADPTLEGLRVPQVPRHQVTIQIRRSDRSLGTMALQARWSSDAFEDDQNRLRLAAYAVLDALWSRPLARTGLALFLAGENLTDERYDVGRTPTHLVGAPRTWRGGLRVSLGG